MARSRRGSEPACNWKSSKFNLPASVVEAIPQIGEHDTAIVMHNDGVVQGLSEVPFMQNVKRWGVLTIGTGLGNARFTNRYGRAEACYRFDAEPAVTCRTARKSSVG